MPWLRGGDNAATHPNVMALATVRSAKPHTLNEVFGFVLRCAFQSAGHMTDYYVDLGTAAMLGNGRHELLLRQGVEAGLLTVEGSGRTRKWKLLDDPEFLHLRLRDEVERERQRKRDNANPNLTAPVRLRDGDECRYCRKIVNWTIRSGARGGTYDHLDMNVKRTTVDLLVVACNSCNSSIKDTPLVDRELLDPPEEPFYSPITIRYLNKHGYTNLPTNPASGEDTAQRSGSQPVTASRPTNQVDTATATPDQDTGHRADARPGTRLEDTARAATPEPSTDTARGATRGQWEDGHGPPPGWVDLQIPAGSEGSARVGSGRDGSGLAPPGVASVLDHPPHSPDQPPDRRRARRGSRGKKP